MPGGLSPYFSRDQGEADYPIASFILLEGGYDSSSQAVGLLPDHPALLKMIKWLQLDVGHSLEYI